MSLKDDIFSRQYAIREGETFAEGVERVVNTVAATTADRDVYRELLLSNRFSPGGRIWAGAGTSHGQLNNCFVVSGDGEPGSTEWALTLTQKLATITRQGGGTGLNLDGFGPKRPYSGPQGKAYLTIHPGHDDYEHTKTGTYKNLVHNKYETKGYRALTFLERGDMASRYDGIIYVKDSTADIWDAAARMVRFLLEGRDVLIDVSALRPEGSPVKGSGGDSSGAASFAVEVFDNFARWAALGGAVYAGPVATLRYLFAPTLRVIRQGGTRRGAGMATLSVTHPDIHDFITSKDLEREALEGDIGTYNISVLAGSKFMGEATSREPVPESRELLTSIAEHAWQTGEPGLLFVDTINSNNPLALTDGPILATNPCGEIGLYPGEPCCLGALNLNAFVGYDEGGAKLNLPALERATRTAVRFLDDVLDASTYPLPEIAEAIKDKRRIGLGFMGLADMLIRLGLRYNSDAGRECVFNVVSFIRERAEDESGKLGEERGVPSGCKRAGVKRRNIALLTVAPTGTTSMLAEVSSGVEPVFSGVTFRKIGSDYVTIVHPLLEELLDANVDDSCSLSVRGEEKGDVAWGWDAITAAIGEHHGSVLPLVVSGALPDTREFQAFVTAHDVEPQHHVWMQSTVQQAFDGGTPGAGNSISKTINMPNSATVESVLEAYELAWAEECKGITVYRDGSRSFQVLSTSAQTDDSAAHEAVLDEVLFEQEEDRDTYYQKEYERVVDELLVNSMEAGYSPVVSRPKRVLGHTDKFEVGGKKLYVTVNKHEGDVVECFIRQSRATDEQVVTGDIIGRLISLALKYGAPVEQVAKQLQGQGHFDATGGFSPRQGYVGSRWELVAHSLLSASESALPETVAVPEPVLVGASGRECPECSALMVREEGCMKCHACGYAACG